MIGGRNWSNTTINIFLRELHPSPARTSVGLKPTFFELWLHLKINWLTSDMGWPPRSGSSFLPSTVLGFNNGSPFTKLPSSVPRTQLVVASHFPPTVHRLGRIILSLIMSSRKGSSPLLYQLAKQLLWEQRQKTVPSEHRDTREKIPKRDKRVDGKRK